MIRFCLAASALFLSLGNLRADPIGALSGGAGSPLRLPKRTPEFDRVVAAFAQRDYDKCLQLLRGAAKSDPEIRSPRLVLTKLFLLDKQAPRARASLEEAVREAPTDPENFVILGLLAIQEGRGAEAQLDYEKALQLVPNDRLPETVRRAVSHDAYLGLNTVAQQHKDWNLAEQTLSTWLTLEPKHGEVRQELGRALFRLGKIEPAYEQLQQAFKDDPNLEPAATTMGWLFAEAHDPAKAAEWMEKGIQEAPKEARPYVAYANLLLDKNEPEKAKQQVDKATQLSPNSEAVKLSRGLTAWCLHDYESAERIFREVHQDAPANFQASNYLALALVEQESEAKHKQALELAEINTRLLPNSSEALATAGWVYYKFGRLEEAERMLRGALSGTSASSDTAYFMARILADRGRTEEAKTWLTRALQAQGIFAFRKDAQDLLNRVAKKS
jgi:tetratricopeptide (TPR) repeat protein